MRKWITLGTFLSLCTLLLGDQQYSGTVAGAHLVNITAGVAAKATSPVATDVALVVVKSPNGGNPCVNSGSTLQSTPLNASTTSAVQIVALVAGQKIYVCSLTVQGGGTTPTFSLVYGTGTNCATGQTVLVTAIGDLTANSVIAFPSPVGVTAAANALCTLLTGTSPTAKGVLSYVQQ